MPKKQRSGISLSTLGVIIFIGFFSISMYFTPNVVLKLWGVFGIIICIAIFLLWAKGSFRPDIFEYLNKKTDSPNARLTCKNGHTCKVWINMDGYDRSIYHGPSINDIIYDVGGHEVRKNMHIVPDRCPECGAAWQAPKKSDS